MRLLSRIPWKCAARCVAVSAGILVVGAGMFVLSGIYNVAASVPHLTTTERLIELALGRSVALRSIGIRVPDLSDPGLVRLGARHFEFGCAPCHGSPASEPNPVVRQMYPVPPPLSTAVAHWNDAELFWIVEHGIKMTGMPGWAGQGRDGEIWAITAFLRALSAMEPAQYAALTGVENGSAGLPADLGSDPLGTELIDACAACHGDEDSPPVSSIVPALQGQKALYLARSLREYRSNLRQSGIMEPIAAALGSDEVIAELARVYAARPPPPGDFEADPKSILRGRAIAQDGIDGDELPACSACHSHNSNGNFPLLDGLSQTYLETQLELFRTGIRDDTAYGAVMSAIAPRLSVEQIHDVTAYFASISRQKDGAESPVGAAP